MTIGDCFSQTINQGGSTCIFMDLPCIILDVSYFRVEKIIELWAVQNNVRDAHFIKIHTYRSPAGNFNLFLNLMDTTLKHLCMPKMEFILCGDLNVYYLIDC
jgi:hypothetical protein